MVSLTKIFSEFVYNAKPNDFNDEMKFFSKMSMLDWAGVAYAGRKEPVSNIVTKLIEDDKSHGNSRIISNGVSVNSKSAALVNDTIGHALDYDCHLYTSDAATKRIV